MSWRDKEVGRSGVTLSKLSDDESVTISVVDEPYWDEHEVPDGQVEAFHVPCRLSTVPDGFTDMSDNDIGEEKEYDIINSGSGFFANFRDLFSDSDPVGSVVEITAYQPSDEFSRYYGLMVVK